MDFLNQEQNNLLKIDDMSFFKANDIKFTVSSRALLPNDNINSYISTFFPFINSNQIESFFGFTDQFSKLYGGRGFGKNQKVSKEQIEHIYSKNIGYSITLTNNYFDEQSYIENQELLTKHHKEGNSIVCVNDELALRIKKDFPLYKLKASMIKNLNSLEKVEEALKLYDYVVIPMELNDNNEFLKSLPHKERIILFANGSCAYNCTSRICYQAISKKIMFNKESEYSCSKDLSPREKLGTVFFDIEKLYDMGFKHFKLIPHMPLVQQILARENVDSSVIHELLNKKYLYYIYSFPKSGRTWLRYILANYLNLYFDLNLDIDLHSIFNIIPNDNNDLKKGPRVYNYFNDERFPTVVASHTTIEYENNDGVIILLRNVLDVMVSDYFQHRDFLKKFDGSISEFIKQTNSLKKYCHFINSIDQEKYALVITYEMMHENILEVSKVVLEFLDIDIDEDILEDSITLSSFENMQKIELKSGIAGKQCANNNKDGMRVREGKVNNYTKYLNEDDIEYIKNFCNQNLTDNSKQILDALHIGIK